MNLGSIRWIFTKTSTVSALVGAQYIYNFIMGASSQQCFVPIYANNTKHPTNEMHVLIPTTGVSFTTAAGSLLTPVSLLLFHGTVLLAFQSSETHRWDICHATSLSLETLLWSHPKLSKCFFLEAAFLYSYCLNRPLQAQSSLQSLLLWSSSTLVCNSARSRDSLKKHRQVLLAPLIPRHACTHKGHLSSQQITIESWCLHLSKYTTVYL